MSIKNRRVNRSRIHFRIRKKVSGTAARPRLAVFFSNQHVYAQLIDDDKGVTLASASTQSKEIEATGSANKAVAEKVGQMIAERGKAANIENVVFDRGGFIFHGKVKALADAARAGGLKF